MESTEKSPFQMVDPYIEKIKKSLISRYLGDNVPTVLIAIALFGLSIYFLTSKKRRNYPPAIHGTLPIIGNMLQLRERKPYQTLTRWAEKYGPIYRLRIGALNVVVLNSDDLIKEALVTKYDSISNRRLPLAVEILGHDKSTLVARDYGPHYSARKRHLVTHLLGPMAQKEKRSLRHELVVRMINGMFEDMPTEGKVVHMRHVLNNFLFENTMHQLFGFAPKEMYVPGIGFLFREQMCKILVDDPIDAISLIDWRSLWPIFKWASNEKVESVCKQAARQRDLLCEELLKMYKIQFALKGPTGCYADHLHQDAEFLPDKYSPILYILWESVIESVDTVSVASEWIIYELARNPHVQDRLYQEIKNVSGDRMINEDDMANLPYLDAVIKETLRLYNPVTVLFTRLTGEDMTLGGYNIPKGWDVLINQWGIGMDKRRWPDADVWDPERCLRDPSIDLGFKDFKITPFGGGKRMCPGIHMAMATLLVEVCGLVQHFEFSVPPDEGNADAESSQVSFTTHKATPLLAFTKPRVKGVLPS